MGRKTGKSLEKFVEKIESIYRDDNTTIETNKRVIEDGETLAEFDIVVEGNFCSTTIKWLIECRDRPSSSSEGVSWIEQLSGRKNNYNFDRVTAVSTTGFSPAAVKIAEKSGIELRELDLVEEEDIDWLPKINSNILYEHVSLQKAKVKVIFKDNEGSIEKELEFSRSKELNNPMLVNLQNNKRISLRKQYLNSVREIDEYEKMWEELPPNDRGIAVNLTTKPNDKFEYMLQIESNVFEIIEFEFQGRVSKIYLSPLFIEAYTYKVTQSESTIANQVIRVIRIPDGPEFKLLYTETEKGAELSIIPPDF